MTQTPANETEWLNALQRSRNAFWEKLDSKGKAAEVNVYVGRWIDFLKQYDAAAAEQLHGSGHPAVRDQLTGLLHELDSLSAMLKATAEREIRAIVEKSNREIFEMQMDQSRKSLEAGQRAINAWKPVSQQGPDVWGEVRAFQQRSDAMWRDVLARGLRRK
jgi:hypothetical protein